MGAPGHRRRLVLALAVASFLLALLRFVHLEADFPVQLTSSEAPYTDEGWYTNAAVRHHQRGVWHLEGDVNEATVMPLFHVVQRLGFAAFGRSFASARLVAVLCWLALMVLAWRLVHRESDLAGALCALVLAAQFHLFAYSRVALVELPMLLPYLGGLLWMHESRDRSCERNAFRIGAVAGAATAIAALLKFSAVFFGPAMLLAAVALPETRRGRGRALLGYVVGATLAPAYWLVQASLHPEDVRHFFDTLFGGQQHSRRASVARTAYTALRDLARIDLAVALAAAIAGLHALRAWRPADTWAFFARLDVQLLGFAALSWLLPAITLYQPTRYLMPPLVFLVVAASLGVGVALDRSRTLAGVLATLLVVSALLGIAGTVTELRHADSSLLRAAHEVERIVPPGATVMGDVAPQLALEIDIWAVSGALGSAAPVDRFEMHRPTFWIRRGPLTAEERRLVRPCEPQLATELDVFGNRTALPLHLFRLDACSPEPLVP